MPHVETRRGTLFYKDYRQPESERPPLLLIHGAGGTHQDMPVYLRRMAGAQAIAPDLPGHGQSAAPGRQTITDYAADMVALLDALSIDRANVAGHSMGGAIAQQIALDAPERVNALVLMGTGARLVVNDQILTGILEDAEATAHQIMKWAWAADTPDDLRAQSVQRLLQIDPTTTHGDYVACNTFDVRERLGEIRVPTLILSADADKMTPPRWSAFLAEHITGAEHITYAGAGHMFPLERGQQVAADVQRWLAQR